MTGRAAAPRLETIERILRLAVRAPSAENCQPWTYVWRHGVLEVHHDPERARKGSDRAHHDSLLALGCLLEAVEVAADAEGLRPLSELSVDDPRSRIWATVRFVTGHTGRAELLDALTRRCTDRRPFRRGRADHPVFDEVRSAAVPGTGLHVLTTPSAPLLGYLRRAERFLWSHEATYRDVMRWLRVTRREVETTCDGASWQTMGFDLPEIRGLGLLRHPAARRVLVSAGVPRLASRWWDRQLRSAAALVVVTVQVRGRAGLVDAGRSMMRAWLLLTRADHGVQPHSQQAYFLHEAAVGTLPDDVDPRWSALWARGRVLLGAALGLDAGELPVMLLRTGVSDSLPAHRRSLRRPLRKVLSAE